MIPLVLMVSIFLPFITPGTTVFKTSLGPFVFSVTDAGLIRFTGVILKTGLSFWCSIMLVATTRFEDLMHAAGSLGFPGKIVIVLSFMYRYLFILINEGSHLILARDLRSNGKRGSFVLTASGGIIGSLLIRSFEHAERLWYSMLLRGYSGKPATLRSFTPGLRDILFSGIFLILVLCALIAEWRGYV